MACAKVISQFEVLPLDDAGRRRGWTDEEKVRIVEESLRGHRQGSATARRYGISRALLTRWRKEYRLGLLVGAPGFSPVRIAPEPPQAAVAPVAPAVPEKVEITGLLQKARAGDRTCSIFYLKTHAGWRETDHAGGLTINVIEQYDDPE